MSVLLSGIEYAKEIALAIFIVASITDALDGYIARKYNQVSNFGKFADPLADKLLITAALLIFIERGQMASWAAMIIITREFAVTGLRLVAAAGNKIIAAGLSGKIKTVSSIVAICVMLTDLAWIQIGPINVNTICVLVMVITTIWSGVEYFVRNYEVLDLKY